MTRKATVKPKPKIQLPSSIVNQGQFTVRVTSPERREKLIRVMEKSGVTSMSAGPAP